MIPVVGVYKSPVDAEQEGRQVAGGRRACRAISIARAIQREELARTLTVGGEQPGILEAIGSVTGGSGGFWSLLRPWHPCWLPGLGPILSLGALGSTAAWRFGWSDGGRHSR